MRMSVTGVSLFVVSCLTALALTVLPVGPCLAGPEGSVGYWGGLGASDVPDGISGRTIQNDDHDIAVGPDGTPHVVWASPLQAGPTATPSSIIRYAFWDGNEWQQVDGQDIFPPLDFTMRPRIVVDGEGHPHITVVGGIVTGPDTYTKYMHYVTWDGSSWKTFRANFAKGLREMAVDSAGNLNLCWTAGVANRIYFRRWDGTGFSSLAWGDVGWGVSPPPPFLGPDANQWYEAPRIAVGRTGDIYVSYMAITNKPIPGTPLWETFASLRVSKFIREPAPYPLLRIETDRASYAPGATTVTIMLGADNQRDQWVDTKLFLAAYRKEDDELFQFSLPLSLPPHFYFPLSAVFELPIGQDQILAPSGSADLLGAQFLDATTGEGLGRLQWKSITISR